MELPCNNGDVFHEISGTPQLGCLGQITGLLERSWAILGSTSGASWAVLGYLGAVLVLSYTVLVVSSRLGDVLGSPGAS